MLLHFENNPTFLRNIFSPPSGLRSESINKAAEAKLSLPSGSADFLVDHFFDHEDRGDTLHRNVGYSKNLTYRQ
jgi:hypothetical protein